MILGGSSSATKSFLREHSPPSQPFPLPLPPSPVRHIHFGVDSIFSTAPTWLGKISNVFRGNNIFSEISPAQALTPRTHAGNKSKVIR